MPDQESKLSEDAAARVPNIAEENSVLTSLAKEGDVTLDAMIDENEAIIQENKRRARKEASLDGLVKQIIRADAPRRGRLGDLFVKNGLLTAAQVEQISKAQTEMNLRFGDAALALGLLTREDLDSALGEQFGYASRDLIAGKADPSLKILFFPFSREAEEIRRLRSEVLLRYRDGEKIRLAICSPATTEGRSYMAASLAIAFAQLGKRTLLIDADLRTSAQQRYFGLGNPDGLSSILAGRMRYSVGMIKVMPTLHIIPAGPKPPNPLEILRAPNLENLLETCADQFDAFIVDTHAASNASDAQMVAHQVGATVVVARKDQTNMSELRETLDDLRGAGVEVLGTIFNQFDAEAELNEAMPEQRKWTRWLPFSGWFSARRKHA